MRRQDRRWTWVCGLLAATAGCNGSNNADAPPIDMTATDANPTSSPDPTTSSTTGDPATSSGAADTTTGGVANCDDVACVGHGSCEIGEDGMPYCACDPGYVLDESGDACIVDESCVQLRFLEDNCRQLANAQPAVSLFFAVDFCAGTAVLPEKIEELGLTFQVLENGSDIQDNVESFATVIPKPVESYVDLVIDVSESITASEDLPQLVTELRALVSSLVPGADEPDVYVSVHVFARGSAEYVPFTRDLAAVDAALAAIADDPTAVVALADGGDGTDLYDAVELGIHRTQRIRDLRAAVTWDGVLTTGTVVVVTDGNDTSNGDLDRSLIQETTNNVISIGISADVQNGPLQTIGRDGSFLAPAPSDWPAAFAEITQRVDEYPLRSYLLAYCSSTTEGEPNVEISLAGDVNVASTAVCQFDADIFGVGPELTCDAAFFDAECSVYECGGLTACGGCADDACCDSHFCVAPQVTVDDCEGDHEVCAAADLACLDDGTCGTPPALGQACTDTCDPGVSRCVDDVCVPVLGAGAVCEDALDCPELNCQQANPDNPLQMTTCLPGALLYDRCGGDDAVCEKGGYCQGDCLPRKGFAETCGGSDECRNASCADLGGGNVCSAANACFWSWDEKVPA